jgi:glycine oxidase
MRTCDIAVVGGGVIGLSIAYILAREGLSLTVIDAGAMGRAASWAGAGMIAPFRRKVAGSAMTELRSWGAELYREWSPALLDETGIDNGFRVSGGLDVAADDADEADLSTAAGRWRVEGVEAERLDPADFARVEPALNPALRRAYYLPDRAQIRNPRHLQALTASIERTESTLETEDEVLGFKLRRGRIEGLRTRTGQINCNQVILTAGAWSGGLLEGLGVSLATPPLKGQIVLFKSHGPLLSRIIEHGKHYLVPRDDGRVLAGATEEDAGFNTRSTPLAIRELIDEALLLCPALAEAEVERTWAGLRPGSIDTRPYIGRVPGFPNLIVATGHKRAGLQLAPSTAEVVADLVLDREPRIDLAAFAPARSAGPGDDVAHRS